MEIDNANKLSKIFYSSFEISTKIKINRFRFFPSTDPSKGRKRTRN